MSELPKIISKEIIVNTGMMSIEEVHLLFSNGQERDFQRIHWHSAGAVLIVPMLDEDTVLLIKEYAVGLERYTLGFPKGALAEDEPPMEAAQRELQEEIGYGARHLEELMVYGSSPAYSTMCIRLYLAKDLYPQKLEGDEPEPLEVIPWKLSRLDDLLSHPDFVDMRSITALLILARNLHV